MCVPELRFQKGVAMPCSKKEGDGLVDKGKSPSEEADPGKCHGKLNMVEVKLLALEQVRATALQT